ncbi:DUF2750 domain-containing protein [Oceanisphaera arctica]|uniref:DUF2750 domain-containing protein n=1 Tax=Oceanisphaera arctica TaxID=641510 RepID=A0A2P5TLF0_9GAMM|nr:DUF2750 domain-containing protein [Oceanisphaera arctica]PPL16105.1 hypothetical protein UN63_10290 [Oceanisphaera arctica]GHA26315.1 hypothetical protein GCM10007082_28440 [Oceanisphaera arctica]
MSYTLTDADKAAVQTMRDDERFNHFISRVCEHDEIWILTDEHGCMMLTSDDDEDCIPVWPHAEYAKEWAVDDWSQCKPEAISLKVWQSRWVPGMEDDELMVAVFPTPDATGVVVEPRDVQEAIDRKKKPGRHN